MCGAEKIAKKRIASLYQDFPGEHFHRWDQSRIASGFLFYLFLLPAKRYNINHVTHFELRKYQSSTKWSKQFQRYSHFNFEHFSILP